MTSTGRPRLRLLFGVLGLGCLSHSLLQAIVAPVLRNIQFELHTSPGASAWLVTGFMLTSVISIPVLGRLGDMFGKRRVLILCLALILAGLLLSALSGSIEGMIAGRVVQGFGGAVFPVSFSIIREEFPRERVHSGVALISALIGVGGAAGILLAGVIVQHLSLAWLFWLPTVTVALALAGTVLFVPESRTRDPGRVDVPGALLLAGWLLALLIAITQGVSWGWSSWRVLGLFAAAAVGLVAWIGLEHRVRVPLVDMRMMRLRGVWTTNVAAIMFGVGMYGTFLLIPQLVQQPLSSGYGLGSSTTQAVLYLLPSNVVMLLASPVSGWLAGRFGARVPLAIGAGATVVGFGLLIVRHRTSPDLYVDSALMGFGLGLGFPAMANMIVSSVPAVQTGVATGMNTLFRLIGGTIGAQGAATLVAATLSADGVPRERSFELGFAVSAVALFVTLLTTFAMPGRQRSRVTVRPAASP
jgi:EmrB/QacA subfamily drug resistance transporter